MSLAMSLNNQVVLITGVTWTLGQYDYPKYLLENGFKVALCYINNFERSVVNEYANVFGVERFLALQCDVSNQNQFENAFKSCIDHFKRIDIVVNSASAFDASMGDPKTISNMNLECIIRGTILAIKYMGVPLGGRGGSVVQIVTIPPVGSVINIWWYWWLRKNVTEYTKIIGHDDKNPTHQRITFMTLCTDSLSDNIGRDLVHVLRLSKSGDCWVAENGQLPTLISL